MRSIRDSDGTVVQITSLSAETQDYARSALSKVNLPYFDEFMLLAKSSS